MSVALTKQIDSMREERAKLNREDKTKACPECYQEVWFSCYHDGQSVRSKPVDKAHREIKRLEIVEYEIDDMTFNLGQLKDEMVELREKINE